MLKFTPLLSVRHASERGFEPSRSLLAAVCCQCFRDPSGRSVTVGQPSSAQISSPAPSPSGTPAPAPAPAAATGAPRVDTSSFNTPESQHESYTIAETGVIEEAFGHLEITAGLVYVHGGDSNGVLAAASGSTHIGRVRKFLTEVRGIGEQEIPYLIGETSTGAKQTARVYVVGTAGDKLLLVYR